MRVKISAGTQPALVIVYDLRRDPDAWANTCRHGRTWAGSIPLFTSSTLTTSRSCSASDERWREWERVWMEWLRGEQAT